MAVSLLPASPPSSAPKVASDVFPIEVCVTEVPGEMIIRIAGKGCVGQADALAARLLALSARRPSLVRLDLSELNCISSLTMGVLATFHRGVVRAGGRVILTESLREPVHAALERAGLFTLFGSPRENSFSQHEDSGGKP